MATINGGMTMRIIPRQGYIFTGLGASGQATVMIASHIDVSAFQEADLLVRLHPQSVIPSGANVVVGLVTDGYTFDDPAPAVAAGQFFFGSAPAAGLPGCVQITSSNTPPFFAVASMNQGSTTTPFGRLLAVQMIATQGTTGGANFGVFMSLDLVLKGGDPRMLAMNPNSFRGYRIM
jgi:hypothetical protein